MNRRFLLLATASAALSKGARAGSPQVSVKPPVTPKRPVVIHQLGRVRVDDYAWLKPANWKEVWRNPAALDPGIASYLAEEERYCEAVLAGTTELQARLASEMAGWVAPSADEPPVIEGAWAYYSRYAPGAQYPRYLRRPATGGPEEVLLDVAQRAAGLPFFAVVNPTHSLDGALFAWAEDRTGAEKRTIFIKDLATGKLIEGPTNAFGDFVFSPDSRWLFWTWRNENSRPARIYRRPARGGADVLVYEEPDPGYLTGLSASSSHRYIFIRSWNDVTSEVRLVDGRTPEEAPRLVEPRREGVIYTLEHWNDRFVVLTNDDGALDFKLMQAPTATPERRFWRDWIAETRGRTITDMRAFAGHFVRVVRVEGNPTLIVRGLGSDADTPVVFDEAAYTASMQPSPYEGGTLSLAYESARTPRQWLAIDLDTGGRRTLAREAPPNGRTPQQYELLRLHAKADDGALVPITLLRTAGAAHGPAPLLLTAYGAYGFSYETNFSIPAITLVDQGWVWAVAHVRGGSEKGRAWFEAARRLGKKKSFTDFVACAERLIEAGYTAPRRIVPFGFSAGGLIVGVVNNMRPDLWAGVVGEAPFVDVLNTMSDASHPLVPLTRPVWGDPLANPVDYDNIASYSPYENVGAKPYPPALATTAVGDDRVGFWEPAKWIAKLREKSTSGAPMLLHVEPSGGHLGAAGRTDEFRQAARMYAFAMAAAARTI